MTQHSTAFEIERLVPTSEAIGELRPATPDDSGTAAIAAAPLPSRKFNFRKLLLTGAAVAVLTGAAWYGFDYWTVGRYLISTDDAYVKADNTTVAPKVSGYLHEVLVGDNEPVRAGQLLARIDQRDFKAAVTFAAQENKRYTDLAATGFGSVQNAQQAQSRNAGAEAAIARDAANLASAVKQVELLKAEIVQANAALARAQALQSQAELNLEYTSIVAPIDGIVGNRSLRIGQFVQAGTQLMSVVPVAGAYVVANFKETQLTDVRAGQAVEIAVDTFPGQIVHGHVDSIAPASGQEFALLPPDNATGNFTKVVQRIPVKIALDLDEGSVVELRPGMSVIPTVETKSQARIRQAAAALRAPAKVSGG